MLVNVGCTDDSDEFVRLVVSLSVINAGLLFDEDEIRFVVLLVKLDILLVYIWLV